MSKKLKKKLTSIVASIIILTIAVTLDKLQIINVEEFLNISNDVEETQALVDIKEKTFYEVMRVVDGDTFVINYNDKEEKVRLIGVDTPESVHPDKEKNTKFGEEVSKFSKKTLLGKKVELEFDVSQRDKYGRLLAYVYLDGQMYNKMLLKKGYAKTATYPPNVKYVEAFTKLQEQARENKVGLWEY